MRLFGLIFDNFGLKVLALVMAWAVWFMTRESLTEERVIPMAVDVVVQGDDEVEARATPMRVNVTVTGTARSVAEFEKLANPVVIVTVKPEHFPANEEWMRPETFVLDEIQLPDIADPSELRAKSMEPDVIEVRIESIDPEDVVSRDRAPIDRDTAIGQVDGGVRPNGLHRLRLEGEIGLGAEFEAVEAGQRGVRIALQHGLGQHVRQAVPDPVEAVVFGVQAVLPEQFILHVRGNQRGVPWLDFIEHGVGSCVLDGRPAFPAAAQR